MKLLKGINKDSDPIDQPESTYREAWNMLLSKRRGAMSTEEGTSVAIDLSETNLDGYEILGDTLVYDGTHILFLTDGSGNSEVGTFDGDSYETVLDDSKIEEGSLSFESGSNIEAVNLLNDQGEIMVYWTDGANSPRYYNVTEAPDVGNISSINLFPTIQNAPKITLDRVNDGKGSLFSGAYHFGVALYAEDGSRTNYMSLTSPVYINDDSDPSSHDAYDGVPAGTVTSKSINLSIENLDDNYSQFEIVVIRKEAGTIADVEKLPKRSIRDSSSTFTYTGSESTTSTSIDEVVINTADYQTAKTIIEQDDTLYLGNLTKRSDIGYQKFANNITVKSVTKDVNDGGEGLEERDHYGNPAISFYDKSFKRGEVYALYISFVLKNGQESQAYHIPGRAADDGEKADAYGDNMQFHLYGANGTNNMGFWENGGEVYPDNENWDIYNVDDNGDPEDTTNTLRGEKVRHHHFPDAGNDMSFWDGRENSKYAKVLGVQLEDVKIPSEIVDQVRAVKIYYGRRTDDNKRVIDQGLAVPMRAQEDSAADVDDKAWSYGELGSETNNSSGIIMDSFKAIREEKNVGAAEFVKTVGQPEGSSDDDGDDDNKDVFFDMGDYMEYSDSVSLIPIRAITYMKPYSYVSETSKGFSYNIDNTVGESGIAVEFDEHYRMRWDGDNEPWGELDTSTNLDRTYAARVVELLQTHENMYYPFDQQELIFTGFQDNDITKYDPTQTYEKEDGGKAEGFIEIEEGTDGDSFGEGDVIVDGNNLAARPATFDITVTQVPGVGEENDFHYEADFYGENLVSATLNEGTATTSDCVSAIRDMFAGNSTVDADWITSISGDVITITSRDTGPEWNGEDLTNFAAHDEDQMLVAASSASDTAPSSDGKDNTGPVDVQLSVGSTVSNTFSVNESDSRSDIATKAANAASNTGVLSDFSFDGDAVSVDVVTNKITGTHNGKTVKLVTSSDDLSWSNGTITGGKDLRASFHFAPPVFGEDGYSVKYVVDNNLSISELATQITNRFNNDSSITDHYEVSVDDAVISFVAKDWGENYNGDMTWHSLIGSPIETSANMDAESTSFAGGNSEEAPPEKFSTGSVYGADTFIGFYGTRRTAWNPASSDTKRYRHVLYAVVESEDNIKLRHQGESYHQIYYPKSDYEEILNLEADMPSDEYNDDEDFDNYIEYNMDYSALPEFKTPIPMPKDRDSITSYPTRVIRSAEGDQSGDIEGVRTFLEGDYLDLTRSKGPLVKLSVMNNNIFPHMQRALIRTRGREELTTGDFRAYIGAGDIFTAKPNQIIPTRTGFAGLQDPRSAIETPHGYFFVDREAGRVFLIGEEIREISQHGLNNFFYDELTDIDSDGQLISTYDNKWNRILLTKKGEWTLSYYPQLDIWGSFHDYDPEYYLYDINTFYTHYNDSIHQHNDDQKPGEFYGSNESSIIEFIDNREPAVSKHVVNLQFITEVQDTNNDSYRHETFDEFRVSNSYQDSGDKNIIYFTQSNGNARNVEGTWKINKFRDMLVNGSVDNNKPWYNQGHFIDKYTRVKLTYNNSGNKFLYLYDVNIGIKRSNR